MDFSKAFDRAHSSGVLALGFNGLQASDFQTILKALSTACQEEEDTNKGREHRPRKCRRLAGVAALAAKLTALRSQAKKIWKFNVVGNTSIGDEGMQHLNLLPLQIRDLDLSDCSLSTLGIKAVIEYMRTNSTITRLIMWGNDTHKLNEAECWIDLLTDNDTLEELCIWPADCEAAIPSYACTGFAKGLLRNESLRILSLARNISFVDDNESNENVMMACAILSVALIGNRTLEQLEFGICRDPTFLAFWETTLKRNETLLSVGATTKKMEHYLDLNAVQARRLFRAKYLIDEDENDRQKEWERTVIEAAKRTSKQRRDMTGFHALYFLLRQEPGFLTAFVKNG